MSGLARILVSRGFKVFGSDISENDLTHELSKDGAKIFIGHKASNVEGVDFLIVSAAIKTDNPEIMEAKKRGIPIIKRSELLGHLMAEKKGIAVAGTHGKTTTSTMLALVFSAAGLDPAIAIGGEVRNIHGNAKDGKGEYFVAEACEYNRAFLDIFPYGAIITNIEEDHLDIYENLEDIMKAFSEFISQIKPRGFLVYSYDDKNTRKLAENFRGEKISYGEEQGANFRASDIKVINHVTHFRVSGEGKDLGDFSLLIPGDHNVHNALAVIAVSHKLGIDNGTVQKVLSSFRGADRRFQIKGEKNGVLVIDDYGHHPTEIKATLEGLRSIYPEKKVWCVFQAHQYSRTKFLLSDFAHSFKDANHVIVPEIYEARDSEEDKNSVNGQRLAEEINKVSGNARFCPKFEECAEYLKKNVQEGDIVITMGAGPVYKVGEMFLNH